MSQNKPTNTGQKTEQVIEGKEYTPEELLQGLVDNNNDVLLFLYRHYYPYIRFFVNHNSGTDDDAQDIYQEALIIMYKKVAAGKLKLTCTFKTYLYSVCRLLWLKQLEKRRKKGENLNESDEYIDLSDDIIEIYDQNEKYKLYQAHFKKLSKDCQKVLTLSLEKVPLKEIAEIMGYKSDKYAKKRKYQCKERLVKSIKNDPKFLELTE